MTKNFVLIIFFSLGLLMANAQDNEAYVDSVQPVVEEQMEELDEVPIDTIIRVHEIFISADSAAAWKNREEFNYIKNLDSLLRKSQQTNTPAPKRTGSGGSSASSFLSGSVIKFFLWTLAIIFLLVIIYQLAKSGRVFTNSSKMVQVQETADEDTLLLHSNFDELITAAKKADDYRLATRYHFLKILQQLRDKNLINYEPDKTNSRYVKELPLQLQSSFSQLVLQYEFVWYGHHELQWEKFTSIESGFNSFYQKI